MSSLSAQSDIFLRYKQSEYGILDSKHYNNKKLIYNTSILSSLAQIAT